MRFFVDQHFSKLKLLLFNGLLAFLACLFSEARWMSCVNTDSPLSISGSIASVVGILISAWAALAAEGAKQAARATKKEMQSRFIIHLTAEAQGLLSAIDAAFHQRMWNEVAIHLNFLGSRMDDIAVFFPQDPAQQQRCRELAIESRELRSICKNQTLLNHGHQWEEFFNRTSPQMSSLRMQFAALIDVESTETLFERIKAFLRREWDRVSSEMGQ